MEIQKKQLKRMIQIRDSQDANYKITVMNMIKYEDNNVDYYSESDLQKRVLSNPGAGDMKELMNTTHGQWKNPFREAYYWLKGELLDLKGLNDALLGREQVVKNQSATESKKRSDQVELEKLT